MEREKTNIAIIDDKDHCITYEELGKRAEDLHNLISPRNIVLILCDYHIETVSFYYCMMKNHVVPILVDKHLDKGLLFSLVDKFKPSYIWVETTKKREIFEDFNTVAQAGEYSIAETLYPQVELPEELALLLSTSGSTGSPKLVRLSYSNLYSNSKMLIETFQLKKDDRAITTLPMNYCYGLSVIHMHWLVGGIVLITDHSLLSAEFWDFLQRHKATNFAGVPFTFDILNKMNFLSKDFPSLRFITEGGGKLDINNQRLFGENLLKKNIRFYICYGQTETTSAVTAVFPNKILEKPGSIGLPLKGMSMTIGGEESSGELLVSGDSVFMGYAMNQKECMRKENRNEKLHTGDLAYIDEEGYIFLKGRISRYIKILGRRISLDEVEGLLYEKFKEIEFACCGEEDLLIIYYNGFDLTQELKDFCRERLGIHKKTISIRNIECIPRNKSGKIIYSDLHNGL